MLIISYNLRKHRAIAELSALDARHSPDVVCLQEVDTVGLAQHVGSLQLAHFTKGSRLGLAVYYRPDRLRPRDVQAFALKKSLHDRILRPADERLLGVRFEDLEQGRDVTVASLHAAPLTASNSLRRHQINAALSRLEQLGQGVPILMVGDYNYPVFKENLATKIRRAGYDLTLSDARTYTRYKVFRGHFDFATSTGLELRSIRTLQRGDSDHLPILVDAAYANNALAEETLTPAG
ncbi:endonuclease/exonuclease/phosphatase family protein [Arthrobacter woluwensis]|uniref:endonuclease/exonuclease/phosphatase family protein n=1 Tax=Arthrobacter woluwensis TaxID=156980 RepID=UPI0038278C20